MDLEERMRATENGLTELRAQVQPLLGLHASIATLSTQLTELKGDLKTLRGQALLLSGIAVVVAPCVFAVVLKLMHFM